jgi:general stress protein YciG
MANHGGNNDNGNRGFASMNDDQQRKIAQKGGEAVSQDRDHISQIGRKGGEASHGNGNQDGRGS